MNTVLTAWAAIIFLGAGYCLKEKGHIRITLVLGFLPQRLAAVITFLASGLTTAFHGITCGGICLKMVQATVRYHSTSGTLTQTPLWIPQTLMLVGAACFLIQLAGITFKTFIAISTEEEVV